MPAQPTTDAHTRTKVASLTGGIRVAVYILGAATPIIAGAVGFAHAKLWAHDGDIREQRVQIQQLDQRAREDREVLRDQQRQMIDTQQKILDELRRRP